MTIVAGFSFISERESTCGGRWFCCSAMSAAMTANWHDPTVPATQDTGHFIKSASGRVHCGGMSQSDVRNGLHVELDMQPDVRIPPSGVTIDAQLDFGAALMPQLTYGRLPSHLRRWSPGFTGGHMAVLCGTDGPRWGWFDPLAPAGWPGEWVSAADILPALWPERIDGFTRGAGSDVRYVSAGGYELVSNRSLSVPAGARWTFLDGSPGGSFVKGGSVEVYGLIDGMASRYLAEITTSVPYPDGQARTTLVMVESPNPPTEKPIGDTYAPAPQLYVKTGEQP